MMMDYSIHNVSILNFTVPIRFYNWCLRFGNVPYTAGVNHYRCCAIKETYWVVTVSQKYLNSNKSDTAPLWQLVFGYILYFFANSIRKNAKWIYVTPIMVFKVTIQNIYCNSSRFMYKMDTRNTLTQASKKGRKLSSLRRNLETCKRVLCNKHI